MSVLTINPNIVTDQLMLNFDPASSHSFNTQVFPNPLDPYAYFSQFSLYNVTLSRPAGLVSPVGGKPMMMTQTGADPHTTGSYNTPGANIAAVIPGNTYTWSYYTYGNFTGNIDVSSFFADASGTFIGSGVTEVAADRLVKPEWKRVYVTSVAPPTAAYIQLRIDMRDPAGTDILLIDGVNITNSSVPLDFTERIGSFTNTGIVNLVDGSKPVNAYGSKATLTDKSLIHNGDAGCSLYTTADWPLLNTDSFTLEGWYNINPSWTSNSYRTGLFSKGVTDGAFGLCTNATGTGAGSYIRNDVGGASEAHITITKGSWFHVAMAWDGANKVIYHYGNGELLNPGGTSWTSANTFDQGSYGIGYNTSFAGAAGAIFKGQIGPQRLYKKCLTSNEIKRNFNAIRGRFSV